MKKLIALLLALVMVIGLVACGKTDAPAADDTKPAADEPAKDDAPKTEDPATEEREHVELVVYNYIGDGQFSQPGWSETVEAVNEYLKEKLNTTIDFHFVSQSEYTNVVGPIVASGSDVDMVFTRSSILPFLQYVGMNAFLPLEDYVDEYLPKTKELLPEASWDAVTVNGHLYAVPMERDAATRYCMLVNTTLTDDLGVTVPDSYSTMYELEDFFYDVKAARDEKYPEKANQPITRDRTGDWNAYYYTEPILGEILGANVPGLPGVEGMGDGEKVYCPYLTEEYKDLIDFKYKITKDGIMAADKYDPEGVLEQAGEFSHVYTLGNVYVDEDMNMPYYKTKLVADENAILATAGYQHGYAITANCKNVERCLEVADLMNSDPYLATIMRFGPEGIGWTDEDNDGQIEETDLNSDTANRYCYYWYGWNLGGLTVSKLPSDYPKNFSQLLSDLNDNAVACANVGFILDQTPIADEIAACTNVIAEYREQLISGLFESTDPLLDEFVQKLKDNGIEKIIAEAQTQLDAWRSASK